MASNRGVIIHPARWRLLPFLNGLAPWLLDAVTRREYARIRALLRR